MLARLTSKIRQTTTPLLWEYASDAAELDSKALFELLTSKKRHGPKNHSQQGDGSEFFQLRTYQDGDPPSRIDWKSSAKRDVIIVKEHERDFDPHLYFGLLNDTAMDYKGETQKQTRREAIKKFALSVALAALKKNYQIGVCGHTLLGRTEAAAQTLPDELDNTEKPQQPLQNLILFISGLSDPIPFINSISSRNIMIIACFDPDELDLPFDGQGLVRAQTDSPFIRVDNFSDVRAQYQKRLLDHIIEMRNKVQNLGFTFSCLRTNTPASKLFEAMTKPVEALP